MIVDPNNDQEVDLLLPPDEAGLEIVHWSLVPVSRPTVNECGGATPRVSMKGMFTM